MCMNCGCGQPDERHGKPENITAEDLRRAAAANGQSLRTSARHISEAVDLVERSGRADAGNDGDERLSEPAGAAGAAPAERGTPESES